MIHTRPKEIQVKELIEILSKCNQESWVCVGWCDKHWHLSRPISFQVGVEEYEDKEGRTNVMIGSEDYFNEYEDEDE